METGTTEANVIGAAAVAEVLGGEDTLHVRVRSAQDLEAVVQRGLPVAALGQVVRRASANPETRRALVAALIPEATLKRRRQDQVFTAAESERVERLARVVALATDAFGDETDARLFLETPHPLLEGRAPAAAARTELGARRVEDILGRMTHGIAG